MHSIPYTVFANFVKKSILLQLEDFLSDSLLFSEQCVYTNISLGKQGTHAFPSPPLSPLGPNELEIYHAPLSSFSKWFSVPTVQLLK